MAEAKREKIPVLPPWFKRGVIDCFKAGISSVFILYGDITCLVPNPCVDDELLLPYIPLQELFARVFDTREIVIFYNIATGMRFLEPEMEKEFRVLAELSDPDDNVDVGDPVAAAKADLAAKKKLPSEVNICLPLIEKVLKKNSSVAVIIEAAHFIAPEASGGSLTPDEKINIARLRAWAQDARVKNKNNVVILLTDLISKVSGELRQSASRIATVFIPKASDDERYFYIKRLAKGVPEQAELEKKLDLLQSKLVKIKKDGNRDSLQVEIDNIQAELKKFPPHFDVPDDFDINSFVNATQGMSLRQILEIFRSSAQAKKPISLFFVKEKKIEILNSEYGEVMEVCEPQWSLDQIGGLAKQKLHFSSVLEFIRKGERRLIPQGITIMGPPGTGKTALVEALATGASYNFVKMKNARSMWVGMSEEKTEKQIQGLWALAPAIVMNDEADLGEANRDSPKGDSGVSERIMQAWMRFLSDPRIRGRIVMVNCTNRPDRLDAAMKRSGRSDDRIAILMPSREEREAIFKVMFTRYKISTDIKDDDFGNFADLTAGLSGADIESIALKSLRFAGEKGKKKVGRDDLSEAIADFIPSASQADIDLMTLLAISESSSRRLLPDGVNDIINEIEKRNLNADGAAIVAQIRARSIC